MSNRFFSIHSTFLGCLTYVFVTEDCSVSGDCERKRGEGGEREGGGEVLV